MISHQLDLTSFTSTLGLAIQPVFYPEKSVYIHATDCQLLQKNTVGDRVEGL